MNNNDGLIELEHLDNKINLDSINIVDFTTYDVLKLLRETNSVILKNYRNIMFWTLVNICLIFVTFMIVMFMPQIVYDQSVTSKEVMFLSYVGACSLLSYYLYYKVITEHKTNIEYVENQKKESSWLSLVFNFLGFMLLLVCFLAICYGLFIQYSKLDTYLNSVNFTNSNYYELVAFVFVIGLLLVGLYIAVCRLIMKLVMYEIFAKGNNVLKAFKMVFKNILHNKNNVLLKIFTGSFIIEILSNIIFGVLAWILEFFALSSSEMLPSMVLALIISIGFVIYSFYIGTFVYLTYMSADVD